MYARGIDGQPQTWHHGVVAKWWAEFNVGGPEVEYFRAFIEGEGQPALDAGCGTGRLLLPYLRSGLDVDGCDVSADMLALCREAAEREGLAATLYRQALHELDLQRRYRTIIVCGAFGLAATREQDEEALRRLHAQLEPGGVLLLDNEVPYAERARHWAHWPKGRRGELPEPWPESDERRRGSDGAEYQLLARLISVDPLEQCWEMEMRGKEWRGGALVASETHRLRSNLYFAHELRLLVERAGFADVTVRAGYADREPTTDDDTVVYIARK